MRLELRSSVVSANLPPIVLVPSHRLHATSIPYHAGLAKKKPTPDPYPTDSHSAKEKILAGEALGLVMISHGEDLQNASRGYGGISGEGGKLGEMLEKFGRGRCRVAAAQEEFTNRLGENYVAGMENALEVVKEYLAQRKKLDSKRYVDGCLPYSFLEARSIADIGLLVVDSLWMLLPVR
jgi:hypothetical protein